MPDEIPRRPVSSKIVYENPWIKIHEDQTITTDGQEGMYGYMETKDSVMVIVLDDKNGLLLQKAFRYPTKSWGWEAPGGSSDGEEVLQASKRELEEETGILAQNWEMLGNTVVCNGLMTERQTTCIAWNISHDGEKEESDEIFAGSKWVTFAEAADMVAAGEIDDNQTITGIYLAEKWLERKNTER